MDYDKNYFFKYVFPKDLGIAVTSMYSWGEAYIMASYMKLSLSICFSLSMFKRVRHYYVFNNCTKENNVGSFHIWIKEGAKGKKIIFGTAINSIPFSSSP